MNEDIRLILDKFRTGLNYLDSSVAENERCARELRFQYDRLKRLIENED